MDKRILSAAALLAAVSTSAWAHDDRPPRYLAFELPAPDLHDPQCLDGFATVQFAGDVNNRRFVVGGSGCFHDVGAPGGTSLVQRVFQPYAWSPQTGSYLLPGGSAATALATDIFNNAYGFQIGANLDGVKWPPGGGLSVVIGADPACGFGVSIAVGANARGEIAGSAFRLFEPDIPFFCTPHMVVEKPTGEEVVGPDGGNPTSITNSGVVAGSINNHAAKWNWRTGEITMLRPVSDLEATVIFGINERGTAVGQSTSSLGPGGCGAQPLLWDSHNREHALPNLPGAQAAIAFGINEENVVVGNSSPQGCGGTEDEEAERAVIWSGGRVTDLNRLVVGQPGVVLISASHVTDRGDILAVGFRSFEPKKSCPQLVFPPDGSPPHNEDGACHDTHTYLLRPID